jgi:uncharacterized protein YggE
MSNAWFRVLVLTVLPAGLIPAVLRADERAVRTVNSVGFAELKRQPDILRVQVEIQSRGKDLKEALAKLRERRAAAQRQLDAIGATPGSVQFTDPRITPEGKASQQARMMLMMQRMQNPGQKPAKKAKEAPTILVSCGLKAELPLQASSPEELLLMAHALEERMKAADLGGRKELKRSSPQDEELSEEEATEMMDPNAEDRPKPGEPVFLYISKVTEEEHAKLLAESFQKARREAGRLARAAGAELGALTHLEDNSAQEFSGEEEGVIDNPYTLRLMQQMMGRGRPGVTDTERQPREAMGMQPGKVSYRVALSTVFELIRRPSK